MCRNVCAVRIGLNRFLKSYSLALQQSEDSELELFKVWGSPNWETELNVETGRSAWADRASEVDLPKQYSPLSKDIEIDPEHSQVWPKHNTQKNNFYVYCILEQGMGYLLPSPCSCGCSPVTPTNCLQDQVISFTGHNPKTQLKSQGFHAVASGLLPLISVVRAWQSHPRPKSTTQLKPFTPTLEPEC